MSNFIFDDNFKVYYMEHGLLINFIDYNALINDLNKWHDIITSAAPTAIFQSGQLIYWDEN